MPRANSRRDAKARPSRSTRRVRLRRLLPPVVVVVVAALAVLMLTLVDRGGVTVPRLEAAPTRMPAAAGMTQQDHSVHLGLSAQPLIDGAEQPYLIPDDVAIRALVQTLSTPVNANDPAQLEARIGRLDLDDADKEVLVRELRTFSLRAADQKARMEVVRPNTVGATSGDVRRFAEEKTRLNVIMGDVYDTLQRLLSVEGAARLRQELQNVKAHIRIYPAPDMGTGHP